MNGRLVFLIFAGVWLWQWWLWVLARFLHIHSPFLWLFPP
jgi:hypothetical protein